MTNFTISNIALRMNNILDTLLPEEQLLISLCRLEFSTEQKTRIRELMEKVTDWGYFVRMANGHGIIALCWYNIVETGNSDLIPQGHLETLHKGYLISLTRNTKIYTLLDEVLDLAYQAEIKVVLLKGVALEKTIYGNRGLRQMNDLDILVRREDAIKLRKVLLNNEYESDPMYSPLHEKILPNYGKHLPEMYKNGLTVEIHFNLFDKSGDSLTRVAIEQSVGLQNNQSMAYYLSPLNEFLYLVRHLDKHEEEANSQLRMYTDLVLMLGQYTSTLLNDKLIMLANEAGLGMPLYEKIFILRTYWGETFPWENSEKQRVPDPETVSESFIRFVKKPGTDLPPEISESLLKPLKDLPKLYDKLLFLTGCVFPSLKFMMFRYKTSSGIRAILYYPVRWMKLLSILVSGRL